MAWTYTNVPGLTGDTAKNYNVGSIVNGLGPRTLVVKVAKTDLTSAELNTIVKAIQQGEGTGQSIVSDAFTVAAIGTATGAAFVSGTTDVLFLVLQGTGTYTADGSNAHGVTGAVTTIESVFVDAV